MKAHEEWVDGSWSVDCVCGVDYDDGKEMVNCDECGVWVHTWCCGYVKGGDDLFACHKCSSNKINKKDDDDDDDIETTKLSQGQIVKRSCNNNNNNVRDVPLEERVHVQGVPGGDVTLFRFPSVFSRQLWKCTGYVPKKFSVEYNEFRDNVCEDTCADAAGGVLFSMSSKENNVGGLVSTVRLKDRKRSNDGVKEEELLGACEDGVKKKVKFADKE